MIKQDAFVQNNNVYYKYYKGKQAQKYKYNILFLNEAIFQTKFFNEKLYCKKHEAREI